MKEEKKGGNGAGFPQAPERERGGQREREHSACQGLGRALHRLEWSHSVAQSSEPPETEHQPDAGPNLPMPPEPLQEKNEVRGEKSGGGGWAGES